MEYSNLLVQVEGPIATVTINRPPANALSSEAIAELEDCFASLEADPAVRVIIVTGAGEYMFVAGADVYEFKTLDAEAGRRHLRRGQELFNRIEALPKPVIAAINGVCLGGGNELAMACDLRIAAESARFGQPEINLGIVPGWGGIQRLVRLIGRTRALELLMTGDMISSAEALRLGLVNKVVPDAELMLTARNIARKLATSAPLALAAIKAVLARGTEREAEALVADNADTFMRLMESEDAKEGVSAFLEKRKPRFAGK